MDLGKDLVAASATPLVLAILAEGESYGYAIIKRVSELSGGHLHWTDGMLYPVLLLIVSALVVDAVALAAIASRISEVGLTPNRVAALGENLILLVSLA